MRNVIDVEKLRAFARRAGEKIPEGPVRARFERLAVDQLWADPHSYCPATNAEINVVQQDWVRDALARGDQLVRFRPDRSIGARLHNFARRLSISMQLAAIDAAKQRHVAHAIAEARRMLAKLDHASFEDLASKTRWLARAFAQIESEADLTPILPERSVAATGNRIWRLVISVAVLRATGREFHNCLARGVYGHPENLRRGIFQYWVLRSSTGAPLVVAMAPAQRPTHFYEVRGPCNTLARDFAADLKILADAIGITSPPPPPNLSLRAVRPRAILPPRPRLPPMARASPAVLAMLRAMEPPCPCGRCMGLPPPLPPSRTTS